MEKITAFIKNNWIWIVLALVAIYFFYSRKKIKEAEGKAIAAFDQLNKLAAKSKQGAEYVSEKSSLIRLVDNASEKERQILTDLLNSSIDAFNAAEKQTDKKKAKEDFIKSVSKIQSDLVTKHRKEKVMTFKAKMDKYGFDI